MSDADANFWIKQVLNLLVCLVGLAWVLGSERKRRDVFAYYGWVVFWAGTAAYYAADARNKMLDVRHPGWVPQVGLYVATFALLSAYILSETTTRSSRIRWGALGGAAIVTAAAIWADQLEVSNLNVPWKERLARWHQALTCLAIMPWAYRLRSREPSRSIMMAIYGLTQLPIYQWSPPAVQSLMGSFDQFNQNMFVAYLLGKVPLISATQLLVQRPDAKSLEPYAAVPVARSMPAEDAPWRIFVSYAFEDVVHARALRDALSSLGFRAFVASDDLNVRIGVAAWSEAIDKVLDTIPVLVVLMSPHAKSSAWVDYEWRSVHQELLSGHRKSRIIPICVSGLSPEDIPRGLQRYHCLDWREGGVDGAGAAEIVRMIT